MSIVIFGGRSDVKGLAATLCARSPIQSLMRMIICGSSDDPYPLQMATSPRGRDGAHPRGTSSPLKESFSSAHR